MNYAQWKRMKWQQKVFWAPLVSIREAWRILILERTLTVRAKPKTVRLASVHTACAWERHITAQTSRSGWGQLILARA